MRKWLLNSLAILLVSCNLGIQPDPAKLTSNQWETDFDFFCTLMNDSFAGFTPQIKKQFNEEAFATRQRLPSMSHIRIMMEFSKLSALLQDGHTTFNLSNPKTRFHRFPLLLFYFDKDLYITGTDESHKAMTGKRLLKIGNKSVDTVLEILKPYISQDNEMEFLHTGPELMVIPEILHALNIIDSAHDAVFTVSDDSGGESTHKLSSISLEQFNSMNKVMAYAKIPCYLESPEKNYRFKYLEKENISYITIHKLLNQKGERPVSQTISDFFTDIDHKKSAKVVIDLRTCPEGHYDLALPLIREIKKRPAINQQGKLFVVTGRTTFSAALVTSVFLKFETNTLVIGEPGRGKPNRADNVDIETMPVSKLYFTCTNRMKSHVVEAGLTDHLPVDIYVSPSAKAFKEGRDEVLEKIISFR
jgi:hypothetical protein